MPKFLLSKRLLLSWMVLCPLSTMPTWAADDELVVVDETELGAYWRADERRAITLQLTEGTQRYGCMALPFVIETDGRVSPGTKPLLVRLGQAADAKDSGVDALFPLVMGALPPYRQTWDKAPDAAIYSSRSVVIGDARLRQRLGDEQWAAVVDRLQRLCRIDDLAGWLQRNPDSVVVQPLPGDPQQLMRNPGTP